jgi:hypothetical protein
MLSIKNLKLKLRKLAPKFISLFKILECINKSMYKLRLLSLYNKLYLAFYISLFEEYCRGGKATVSEDAHISTS